MYYDTPLGLLSQGRLVFYSGDTLKRDSGTD